MVARLTPDQKAACSNHVGVKIILAFLAFTTLNFSNFSCCITHQKCGKFNMMWTEMHNTRTQIFALEFLHLLFGFLNYFLSVEQMFNFLSVFLCISGSISYNWLRGAMVARLTPDQKAACSNHVGVKIILHFFQSHFDIILALDK